MVMAHAPEYDFIINKQQPKKPLLPIGGGKSSKLLLAIAGGVGLLFIVLIVGLLLSAAGDKTLDKLTTVAITQQEIIRLTENNKSITDESVKNFVVNTNLTVQTDQKAVLAFLKGKKVVLEGKQLATGRDTKADNDLTQASQVGEYNTVLKNIITQKLETYQTQLQEAFNETSNSSAKKIINDSFNHNKALLGKD